MLPFVSGLCFCCELHDMLTVSSNIQCLSLELRRQSDFFLVVVVVVVVFICVTDCFAFRYTCTLAVAVKTKITPSSPPPPPPVGYCNTSVKSRTKAKTWIAPEVWMNRGGGGGGQIQEVP